MKKKVLVLAGGSSPEREICLLSGRQTVGWLLDAGYDAKVVDPIIGTEGLLEHIKWADFAIIRDEDGTQQDLLDLHHLPYLGANGDSSRICIDKQHFKNKYGSTLKMPFGQLLSSATEFLALPWLKNGFVLKPVDGGSSIDTLICTREDQYEKQYVNDLFSRNATMLVEQYIDGVEIAVGIFGDTAMPVVEIIPPNGEKFDFNNKYNGKSLERCPPQLVTKVDQKKAQGIALEAHKISGCRDLSRSDMIVSKDDGEIYLLEVNTIPGMSKNSIYPKAAEAMGYSMQELLSELIEKRMQ